jgi:hypothetical protein
MSLPGIAAPRPRRFIRQPQLGWWAVLTLCLIAALVLDGDLSRFQNPDGEKKVPLFPPGQNDFSYAYLGARAILAGVNPYRNNRPEFTHPIWPPGNFGGFKQLYPPGNLLSHVPLALWKGLDTEGAGRIWFRLSLVELLIMSAIAWGLSRTILDLRLTWTWVPFFFICLTLNTGVELALERGQSDVLAASLAWGAIVCFLGRRPAASTFLSIWSTSMKGYPILLALGLGLLALDRRQWRGLLAGGILGLGIFLFPVRHLMRDAARALEVRRDTFWAVWYNHSFRNFVETLSPGGASSRWRHVVPGFALVVTAATLLQVRRALAKGPSGRAALWMAAFGSSALGTMVGFSGLSISYNLILVLPGVLVLVACQRQLAHALRLPGWGEQVLGAALLVTSFLLFSYRLRDSGPPISGTGLAASAFGLVAMFLILAVAAGLALTRTPNGSPGEPASDADG